MDTDQLQRPGSDPEGEEEEEFPDPEELRGPEVLAQEHLQQTPPSKWLTVEPAVFFLFFAVNLSCGLEYLFTLTYNLIFNYSPSSVHLHKQSANSDLRLLHPTRGSRCLQILGHGQRVAGHSRSRNGSPEILCKYYNGDQHAE